MDTATGSCAVKGSPEAAYAEHADVLATEREGQEGEGSHISHIIEGQTVLKDLDAVKAAVAALGGEWLEGQRTYRWYGTWVGDTPMPEGMTKKDLGKCDHAFRFPGASYEVGVVRAADGTYRLRWDYWHSGGLLQHMGDTRGGKFLQRYGLEVAKRAALRKGYRVMGEKRRQDGSIELALAVR